MIWIPCPHCKSTTRYAVGVIENAIETITELFCVACNEPFRVKVESPKRTAELQRAAVPAAIEMLRQIFETGVLRHAECPSWLSARVSAFLKTAAGG